MMYKIALTGATGLVGTRLSQDLSSIGFEILRLSSKIADLRDKNSLKNEFNKFKPDCVIHCAAMANVELCERNKNLAEEINVLGTKNIIDVINCEKLIYISSDLVFENHQAPLGGFNELDQIGYFSHYAKTKRQAELLCLDSKISNVSVFRISLALDLHHELGYLSDCILRLNANQQLTAYQDEWRTPLFISDLSLGIAKYLELEQRQFKDIFHVSGCERVSRYELALKIAKNWGYKEIQILSSKISEHPGLVPRARDVSLNSTKFWNKTGIRPKNIEQGLNFLLVKAKSL